MPQEAVVALCRDCAAASLRFEVASFESPNRNAVPRQWAARFTPPYLLTSTGRVEETGWAGTEGWDPTVPSFFPNTSPRA